MDDKNSSNVQHPFHAALMTFHAAVRIAFETAAAFWRPWFREPEKKDVAPREQTKAASGEAPRPTKHEQEATEKKPKAPTQRAQRPKRNLRLAEEAADQRKIHLEMVVTKRSMPSRNDVLISGPGLIFDGSLQAAQTSRAMAG